MCRSLFTERQTHHDCTSNGVQKETVWEPQSRSVYPPALSIRAWCNYVAGRSGLLQCARCPQEQNVVQFPFLIRHSTPSASPGWNDTNHFATRIPQCRVFGAGEAFWILGRLVLTTFVECLSITYQSLVNFSNTSVLHPEDRWASDCTHSLFNLWSRSWPGEMHQLRNVTLWLVPRITEDVLQNRACDSTSG